MTTVPASRTVRSADGTSIATFEIEPDSGAAIARVDRPPIVLVHGTASDHTTWRVSGPLLARGRRVFAIDRRGRGASADAPTYSIEREYEDVATVSAALASGVDGPVDVVGHSFGGRVALGAALHGPWIRRVVAYEGAPTHVRRGRTSPAVLGRLEADLAAGRLDLLLERFLRGFIGFTDDGVAAYRANPVWPDRVAAAERTLLRELRAEATEAAGLERLGRVRGPVLLVLGSASQPFFRRGTERLAARLVDVGVLEIAGAAHAAHHTHAPAFVAAVSAFLDR